MQETHQKQLPPKPIMHDKLLNAGNSELIQHNN